MVLFEVIKNTFLIPPDKVLWDDERLKYGEKKTRSEARDLPEIRLEHSLMTCRTAGDKM